MFYMTTLPVLSRVGFHLRTQEYLLVSVIIFVCLTIDTLLIPLLNGANFFEYHDKRFLNKIFKGKNTDFGDDWYQDIGY